MAKLVIKFLDGTEQKEFMEAEESFRIRDGFLIIPKGRYAPSLYINISNVKSFQKEDS
jgi:hypothetical protein